MSKQADIVKAITTILVVKLAAKIELSPFEKEFLAGIVEGVKSMEGDAYNEFMNFPDTYAAAYTAKLNENETKH